MYNIISEMIASLFSVSVSNISPLHPSVMYMTWFPSIIVQEFMQVIIRIKYNNINADEKRQYGLTWGIFCLFFLTS
jgi:hypothetical protein